jgi:hypothetical protein
MNNNGAAAFHHQAIPLNSANATTSINLPGIGVVNSNTAAVLSNLINNNNNSIS